MTTPVILIHGMWCTGASWQRVNDLLTGRGYHCFAPTLLGHEPSTDQPLRVARLGLADYLDDLQAQIAAQAFTERPILIGHSMGGLLAQQLAARIDPLALVLLTPAPPSGINGLSGSTIAAFAPWMASGAFWRRAYKPRFERAVLSLFPGLPSERHRPLYETLVHESGRAIAEIAFWWLDFSRAAAAPASDVHCPVYVVSCERDRLTPRSVVRKIATRHAHATQRIYPDRGHWVIDDDQTEEMMHGICSWLWPIQRREQHRAQG
ncbi:carboxylesterase [Sinimarinibacterium sp. NLF-5-8]|uniref:alpha/beta hydrolase n=1 Tax=Sinimarinibacterium sp. NLF-5-8 TaxID=2698684 RepID=UPI00137BF257|nr:alpha/beta fold hydrolase [Sinimarinibacterium sp. NLF-5-8]QHS09582.1 alpha/beta hydrolase [Sinimarinibacterium sp. NLF-5-8]